MYSEEGFTVCNTGRRSRTFYAKCLDLSANTGSWILCPSFGLILLPMLVFCVGWCYSDLSRYLQTVDPWMSPAGKKDEDRKGLATATSQFRFRKWAGWIRISQITGLTPSLRHLCACLLPATQQDSLTQASLPNASKSLGFVTRKSPLSPPPPNWWPSLENSQEKREGGNTPCFLLQRKENKNSFCWLWAAWLTQWPVSLGCLSVVFACLALCLVCTCVVRTCHFQSCVLVFHWELHIGQELFWGAAGWREDMWGATSGQDSTSICQTCQNH